MKPWQTFCQSSNSKWIHVHRYVFVSEASFENMFVIRGKKRGKPDRERARRIDTDHHLDEIDHGSRMNNNSSCQVTSSVSVDNER